MTLLRKILFLTFCLIYIVCCPLIVMHALGIHFRPGQKKFLVKTGIIHAATIPSGATIYLNGHLLKNKTPAILRNLANGDYALRLELSGYRPWEKLLPVAKEQATVVDQAVLLPKQWEPQDITPGQTFTNIRVLPGTASALLNNGDQLKDFFIWKWAEGPLATGLANSVSDKTGSPLIPLVQADHDLAQSKVTDVSTQNDSLSFLIQTEQNGELHHLWVSLKGDYPEVEDITGLLDNTVPNLPSWSANDNENLFYLDNGLLKRVNTSNRAGFPGIYQNVTGLGVQDKKIYLLTKKENLAVLNYNGNPIEPVFTNPDYSPWPFRDDRLYTITPLDEDILLFLNYSNGELLCNKLPYFIEGQGVRGLITLPDERRILFWTKNKIGSVDFTEKSKEHLLELGPQIRWVTSQGQDIKQVFWFNKGTYALYLDEDRVMLTELRTCGIPVTTELLKVKKGTSIAYSDRLGELFYLDAASDRLVTILIINRGSVITGQNAKPAINRSAP